jgi:hypothetical protein
LRRDRQRDDRAVSSKMKLDISKKKKIEINLKAMRLELKKAW